METNVTEKETQTAQQPAANSAGTVFCKFCGNQIAADAVICTHCGRQVEQLQGAQTAQPQVVINNSNSNVNTNTNIVGAMGRPRNKWTAFFLCLFLGWCGAHKFYEGKAGRGILYLCTFGLLGIGVFIDLINILCKPNPYYV
ncbi:MAG: TM2 domain-containing protein [Oscillospiraceae bacterium]|nr:TM2 domain-containing protein [Oscillospiraceae bacterium]